MAMGSMRVTMVMFLGDIGWAGGARFPAVGSRHILLIIQLFLDASFMSFSYYNFNLGWFGDIVILL